jgi:hypothetical protein
VAHGRWLLLAGNGAQALEPGTELGFGRTDPDDESRKRDGTDKAYGLKRAEFPSFDALDPGTGDLNYLLGGSGRRLPVGHVVQRGAGREVHTCR